MGLLGANLQLVPVRLGDTHLEVDKYMESCHLSIASHGNGDNVGLGT